MHHRSDLPRTLEKTVLACLQDLQELVRFFGYDDPTLSPAQFRRRYDSNTFMTCLAHGWIGLSGPFCREAGEEENLSCRITPAGLDWLEARPETENDKQTVDDSHI